jgi:hypothetical protein
VNGFWSVVEIDAETIFAEITLIIASIWLRVFGYHAGFFGSFAGWRVDDLVDYRGLRGQNDQIGMKASLVISDVIRVEGKFILSVRMFLGMCPGPGGFYILDLP